MQIIHLDETYLHSVECRQCTRMSKRKHVSGSIANKYEVGESTISDISKNRRKKLNLKID